ncbi:hypothetical protein Gotur_001314 [Gossypium turneri]
MNEVDSTWNSELIRNLVDDDTANRILAIPISESRLEDMLVWKFDGSEKIKIHVWRLFNNMVPHYGNLARRMLCGEAVCPLCKEDLETTEHLLGSCRILRTIWTSLQVQIPLLDTSLDYKDKFVKIYIEAEGRQKRFIALSLWCLWFHRNKLIHEGTKFSMPHLWGLSGAMNVI